MNIRGRLLLTAAAALALPIAVQAAPPVVIGDGSVCMDSGDRTKPFPDKGNTHAQRITIVRVIVDTPPAQGSACAPRPNCKGATGCSEYPANAVVTVFYNDRAADGTTSGTPLISATYDAKSLQLNFALGGADWSEFDDLDNSGRQRIIRKTASIDRVLVNGKPASCHPCRVTFFAR